MPLFVCGLVSNGSGFLTTDWRTPYSSVHDAPASDSVEQFEPFRVIEAGNNYSLISLKYMIQRGFLAFDTSGLSLDPITRAVLRVFLGYSGQPVLCVVEGSQNAPLIANDFGTHLTHTTKGGTLSYAEMTDETWHRIILNASGIGWIIVGGTTLLCLRIEGDVDDIAPTAWNYVDLHGPVFGDPVAFLEVTCGAPDLATATTDAATLVIAISAQLNGTLDSDGGADCDCGFEWGETPALGNTTPTQSRMTGQTFSQAITGLTPNRTYYFRAFATNATGTDYGDTLSFVTQSPPNTTLLYAGLDASPGEVDKVDIDTFAISDSVAIDDVTWALAKDTYFLYAGQWTSPAKIARINLASFIVEDTLTLDIDEDDCRTLLLYSGFMYAGLWPAPGGSNDYAYIVKIDLSSFSEVDILEYHYPGSDIIGCRSLRRVGNILYGVLFGSITAGGIGYLVKVDLDDFSKIDELPLTNNGAITLALEDSSWLYIGHYTTPAKVTRIRLEDFTEDAVLTLAADEDRVGPNSMAIHDGFLYVGVEEDPAKIVKIDLATFTKVDTLTLGVAETYCEALAVLGSYLYAGTLGSGVVKVDLATFTQVDTIPIGDGVDSLLGSPAVGARGSARPDVLPLLS